MLRLGLEEEGWNVIDRFPGDEEELEKVWEERKEIREASIAEETESLVKAEEITSEEAEKLESKKEITEVETQKLKKHQIKQTYGVETVTKELVEADAKNLQQTMRLRFWLKDGRKYVVRADRDRLEKLKERGGGNLFIPDVNKVTNITRVKLLEMCQLDRFLEGEWNNQSPELIEVSAIVFRDLVHFNQVLRCGIAVTDSPITILQKILKQINYRLPYLRNERDGKKRLRIYGAAESRFENLEQEETQMLAKWLKQCQEKFDSPEVA